MKKEKKNKSEGEDKITKDEVDEIVRLFKTHGTSSTLVADLFVSPQKMQAYIDAGGPLDIQNEYGQTLLHIAIRDFNGSHERLDVMRILLENGANVKTHNYTGLIPLDFVMSFNNPDVIDLFDELLPGWESLLTPKEKTK